MARFRKRRKGTWFPNLGTAPPEGLNPEDDDNGLWARLDIPLDGSSIIGIFPLTFDHYVDEGAVAEGFTNPRSLADFNQSEYILKRIVGKFFAGIDQVGQNTAVLAAQVTAAFFVAREDENQQAAFSQPIGAATNIERVEVYGPTSVGNVQEPWIWRRQWILGNAAHTGQSQAITYPPNTTLYGSVADGPHIDAKTARRVHRENRLWFTVQARALGTDWSNPFGSVDASFPTAIDIHLDYRLFGTMVKARNTGSF